MNREDNDKLLAYGDRCIVSRDDVWGVAISALILVETGNIVRFMGAPPKLVIPILRRHLLGPESSKEKPA